MANTGDPLGCDIACTTGFPLRMRLCWGIENRQNACIRRLNADAGSLAPIGDDPNYGFNLVSQLNKSYDTAKPGGLASLGQRVRSELEKDECTQSVKARIMAGGDTLLAYMDIETATGVTFPLILGVGEVAADRLNQGLPAQTGTTP